MGIGPATIKSKSELVQPSKRIGYLYNVEPGGLFPTEQAHSSSPGVSPTCIDFVDTLAHSRTAENCGTVPVRDRCFRQCLR